MSSVDILSAIPQYLGVICLVASLLLRLLPTPEEISVGKWYAVLYAFIHKAALNVPSAQK